MPRTPPAAALAFALVLGPAVCEAAPALAVRAGDEPIRIEGTLDGKTLAFAGVVTLTMTGATTDVPLELKASFSDLVRQSGSAKILRTHLGIDQSVRLQNGRPQDVRVTVQQVPEAGT
jgi:hypothetical protein